jgi:hypothetical protein
VGYIDANAFPSVSPVCEFPPPPLTAFVVPLTLNVVSVPLVGDEVEYGECGCVEEVVVPGLKVDIGGRLKGSRLGDKV